MATEIDEMSLHWARLNVENNHLQHRIDLIDQRAFQTLIPTLPTDFDFCMCNPPFYASKEQIQQSIAAKSLHPSGVGEVGRLDCPNARLAPELMWK